MDDGNELSGAGCPAPLWPATEACGLGGQCVNGSCVCQPRFMSQGWMHPQKSGPCDVHKDVVITLAYMQMVASGLLVIFVFYQLRKMSKYTPQMWRVQTQVILYRTRQALLLHCVAKILAAGMLVADVENNLVGQNFWVTLFDAGAMSLFWFAANSMALIIFRAKSVLERNLTGKKPKSVVYIQNAIYSGRGIASSTLFFFGPLIFPAHWRIFITLHYAVCDMAMLSFLYFLIKMTSLMLQRVESYVSSSVSAGAAGAEKTTAIVQKRVKKLRFFKAEMMRQACGNVLIGIVLGTIPYFQTKNIYFQQALWVFLTPLIVATCKLFEPLAIPKNKQVGSPTLGVSSFRVPKSKVSTIENKLGT